MPKSRKRGGEKQHRKRVKARNEKIKTDFERASKLAWETYEKMKKENEDKNHTSI